MFLFRELQDGFPTYALLLPHIDLLVLLILLVPLLCHPDLLVPWLCHGMLGFSSLVNRIHEAEPHLLRYETEPRNECYCHLILLDHLVLLVPWLCRGTL